MAACFGGGAVGAVGYKSVAFGVSRYLVEQIERYELSVMNGLFTSMGSL